MNQIDQLGLFAAKNSSSSAGWSSLPFVAVDVETTGLDPALEKIIELAIIPFNMPNSSQNNFCELFSVDMSLPQNIKNITGITDEMLAGKPTIEQKKHEILNSFKKASFIVAYNASFDRSFLESELARINLTLPILPWVDPLIFACQLDKFKKGKKLYEVAKRWDVELEGAHRANNDAKAAGDILLKMQKSIDCNSLEDLINKQKIFEWQTLQERAAFKRKNTWSKF